MTRLVLLVAAALLLTLTACRGQPSTASLSAPFVGEARLAAPTAAAPTPAAPAPAALLPSAAPTLAGPAVALATSPPATPTVAASPTVVPSPTPSPTPGPTLRRLTDGGCCAAPSWLPDSRRVVFIDRPPGGKAGLYQLDTQTGEPATLFSERLGYYAVGYSLLWQPAGETIRIERLSDGQQLTVRNGGRTLSFAPDGQRVAWQVTPTQTGIPAERRVSEIWVANVDGSGARRVASLLRGGLSGWFPTSDRLVITGRPDPRSQAVALSVLSLEDGSVSEVVRVERLRSASVAPGGGWLLYTVAFHSDKAQNGVWLVRPDGSDLHKVDFYGALQWRAPGKLAYIPLDPDAEWHSLWEYDTETRQSRRLTDPAVTPFKVAGGDWVLAPNGQRVVFVSAHDNNLWALDLPE